MRRGDRALVGWVSSSVEEEKLDAASIKALALSTFLSSSLNLFFGGTPVPLKPSERNPRSSQARFHQGLEILEFPLYRIRPPQPGDLGFLRGLGGFLRREEVAVRDYLTEPLGRSCACIALPRLRASPGPFGAPGRLALPSRLACPETPNTRRIRDIRYLGEYWPEVVPRLERISCCPAEGAWIRTVWVSLMWPLNLLWRFTRAARESGGPRRVRYNR